MLVSEVFPIMFYINISEMSVYPEQAGPLGDWSGGGGQADNHEKCFECGRIQHGCLKNGSLRRMGDC